MSDTDLQLRLSRAENTDKAEMFERSVALSLRREEKALPKLSGLVDAVDLIGLVAMFALAIFAVNALSG
jgi:hypothetical protein